MSYKTNVNVPINWFTYLKEWFQVFCHNNVVILAIATSIHFQFIIFKVTFTLTLLKKWSGVDRIVHSSHLLTKTCKKGIKINSFNQDQNIYTVNKAKQKNRL